MVFLYEYAIKKHFTHHTGLKSFPNTCGFQLFFHSVSQFIHVTRMRRSGWVTTSRIFNEFGNCCLSFSINSVRSWTKRVLHLALICFRLFTRLSAVSLQNFPFHISHFLAFAFVPTRFLDSHRSHVAKERQLNGWYNLISITFLQVPFQYSRPF